VAINRKPRHGAENQGGDTLAPLMSEIVTDHAIVEEVLATFGEALGSHVTAYRGHVYRTLNFANALAGTTSDSLAVAAVFHDLGIWSDGTFDYLAPSAARAARYLADKQGSIDGAEVDRMILLHHKVRPCPEDAGPLAEAFRRADLVDVSFGALRFGLPRAFVSEVRATFPNAGFHRGIARAAVGWIKAHPTRPLPMMRW
jgi:hypothetical protein